MSLTINKRPNPHHLTSMSKSDPFANPLDTVTLPERTFIESKLTVVSFLVMCRNDLAFARRYVQGAMARNVTGAVCDPCDLAAVGWDSIGVIEKNAHMLYIDGYVGCARVPSSRMQLAALLVANEMGGNRSMFHDTHLLKDVLAAWDRAIAEAQRLAL